MRHRERLHLLPSPLPGQWQEALNDATLKQDMALPSPLATYPSSL
ncbi:hypothetical protein ABNN70_14845 [Sporolactobacillus sp. Y61]|uniref:Uncharacterized protein n=1 Tax=Sporolactobacillus sp. Y61 TaxID=3160863 RepID=A0AAU8IEZ6_9BACL